MRVAVVASEYPPHVNGGLGTCVEALTSALGATSAAIDLFVPERPDYRSPPSGVTLRMVPPSPTAAGNAEFWVAFCAGVIELADQLGCPFDLVHCHDWMTALAGVGLHVRYGVPLLFNVHLPQTAEPNVGLEVLGLAAATTGIVNSQAVRQELLERDAELPPCTVIVNGVDTARFEPPTGPRPRDPVVSFVGRLVPQKGVDVLLQAFGVVRRRLPDARLVIAGDGDQTLYLMRLARYLGLAPRVEFIGWQTGDALVRLYQQAAIVAVPSRYEPFGLVALEAMACGCLVVASSTGGLAEIVEDGQSGVLVPPGDHLRLAQQLVRFLGDERGRRLVGEAARTRALQYEWRAVAAAITCLYEAAVERTPQRAAPGRARPASAIEALLPRLSTTARVTAAGILTPSSPRARSDG